MVQSHIAGATSYEEQSLEDIAEDIERWIKYVSDISQFMIQSKQTVQSNGFWDRVTDDFQLTIVSAMRYLDTIIYDLNIVKGAIYANNISDKEVTLLHNIGNKCIEFNNEYGITYHRSDNRWKDYGNSDFKVVEAMYAEGRNMFALLIDAGNAASRLEDYVNRGVVNNNSVSINAPIEGSVQIQQNVANSEQNAKGTFDYKSIMDVSLTKPSFLLIARFKHLTPLFSGKLS